MISTGNVTRESVVLFDIDASCRDVYCVGWRARYIICLLGFFRFEWVYLFHDCVIICLKKGIKKNDINDNRYES